MKPPLATNTDLASILGHGSEQDMAPTEIRMMTEACRALFKKLRNQPEFNILHGPWVASKSIEFMWWPVGIGAEKCGHSSLDCRVRNRDDLRTDLVIHLNTLKTSLTECIDIGTLAPATRNVKLATLISWPSNENAEGVDHPT